MINSVENNSTADNHTNIFKSVVGIVSATNHPKGSEQIVIPALKLFINIKPPIAIIKSCRLVGFISFSLIAPF